MRSAARLKRTTRPFMSALMIASTDESMTRWRKSFVLTSSASTARCCVTSRNEQRTAPSSRSTLAKLTLTIRLRLSRVEILMSTRDKRRRELRQRSSARCRSPLLVPRRHRAARGGSRARQDEDSSSASSTRPSTRSSRDLKDIIVLFNRAAERRLWAHLAEVVGTNVRALYPEGTAQNHAQRDPRGAGRIEGLKVDIVDAANAPVPVSFSGAAHVGGRDCSSAASASSPTCRREDAHAEQRLPQAQEILAQERQAMVAELAGAAAHELNQPLTSVLNYATLLKRLLTAGTPASSAAEVIEGEAERMAGSSARLERSRSTRRRATSESRRSSTSIAQAKGPRPSRCLDPRRSLLHPRVHRCRAFLASAGVTHESIGER